MDYCREFTRQPAHARRILGVTDASDRNVDDERGKGDFVNTCPKLLCSKAQASEPGPE